MPDLGELLWMALQPAASCYLCIFSRQNVVHKAMLAAFQPQAVSLIKEFFSWSVASMSGLSGCLACLRAAMQPAPGLPEYHVKQVGSSHSGSRPLWSLDSSLLLGHCCPAAKIHMLDVILPFSCITSSAGLCLC